MKLTSSRVWHMSSVLQKSKWRGSVVLSPVYTCTGPSYSFPFVSFFVNCENQSSLFPSLLAPDPELSPSYPREVIVPRCIPDLDLVRGTKLYRHGRFPTLSWASQDGSVFLLRAAPTVTHRYIGSSLHWTVIFCLLL